MKICRLVVLTLCFGFLSVSCNSSKKQSEDNSENQQPPSEQEPYINPETNPDGTVNPDQSDPPSDPVVPETVYDEITDSVTDIDVSDMSGLYSTIESINENYTSTINGFFNENGSHDYYRNYGRNYVCDKMSFYTANAQYTLPKLDAYLPVCNTGYLNLNNNYYQFSLEGSTSEERMNSTLTSESLFGEVSNKHYQDDMFTLDDLNESYFAEKGFTRISSNKYQCTNKEVCEQFISICASNLINEGYYLTFSRVTIETNPDSNHILRVRLYVGSTQVGKLISSHKDQESKPNWYLLFSEALISNVGTTTFAPASSLLS